MTASPKAARGVPFCLYGSSGFRCAGCSNSRLKEVFVMKWTQPDFEIIEVCAEVTSYAYQK
ncbi:pyrroloquinoline quinone precursor peptide PqqA [Paenibacillus sp. DMB20]|uniref:pyrroloquinoline quinone precursor peptide PqqA n=1 Tax=Paenibacillus sp. DMB20 TaxID=1642570 RepID=UPI0009E62801